MSVRKLAGPLLLLTASLLATSALAITPINTAQQRVQTEIARQLATGKAHALVIGISDFDDDSWPDLQGVDQEVSDISAAFERQGFQIAPMSKSGKIDHVDLAKRINDFFRQYGQDAENRLVVYIATHGYADPNDPNPTGYLVASDAGAPSGGRVTNAFSVDQLQVTLTGLAAQHVYLFFNSCFSAAMLPKPTRANLDERVVRKAGIGTLSEETAEWTLELLSHNARLALTAGNAGQTVPDVDNPFKTAVVDALDGAADMDGDGLILGTEIGQFVRGRVARETRLANHPNDPVFAVIPKASPPPVARPDAPANIEYALQGDFVFLAPDGPKQLADGKSEQDVLLEDKQKRLLSNQFLACVDCPTMVVIPEPIPQTKVSYALASTEITYAQWDACFRESVCRRFIPDDGFGRGDRPVGGVTWLDALEFTTWLSTKPTDDQPCEEYRLPTAEEWTLAALYTRQGQVEWPTAVSDASPICWGCGPGEDGTAAAHTASSPANAAGLYDMVGNVWEWVDDGDCAADAVDSRLCGDGRVMGGSYATRAEALAGIADGGFAPRTGNSGAWSSPTIGFRVACTVKAG